MKTTNLSLSKPIRAFLIACLLFCSAQNSLTAQTQNSLMSLTPNYYNVIPSNIQSLPLGPNPGNPVNGGGGDYYGQAAGSAHNAMHDAYGNLLFFVVDSTVYDKNGIYIGYLYNNAIGNIQGTSEITIVPDPGNCDRYYIITAGRKSQGNNNSNTLPYFAILDLSLPTNNGLNPGGYGQLVPNGDDLATSIADMTPGFIYSDPQIMRQNGVFIAASKLRNDNSHFVFISNGNGIYRYKIDPTGFHYDGFLAPFVYAEINPNMRGEMELIELNNGNYRIAVPFYQKVNFSFERLAIFTLELYNNGVPDQNSNADIYYDLSNVGGSGFQDPYFHGLEFSPNGRYLYITHDTTTLHPHPIEYFDFNDPLPGPQPLDVTNKFDFISSQIEMGQDGKLYFATSDRLATLSNPDTPDPNNSNWPNSEWDNNAQSISYQANYEGLAPNYKSKLYILPDQIDGMDYTAHFNATVECCLSGKEYQASVFTAPISETWTPIINPFGLFNQIRIEKELIIPAGVTLTLKDMIFEFAPGAKVVVERGTGSLPGGKLILDGTTFTVDGRCDDMAMWQGVQVYGHHNQNQTPSLASQQGQLILKNRSKIEHAMKGAVAVKINQSQNYPYNFISYDFNYTGGIIQASNSSFYNNRQDVEFRTYNAPNNLNNLSRFTKCEFTTYGLLKNTALYPQYHVFMHDVVGIGFYGNKFRNLTPDFYNYWNQGQGIYSLDAKYFVNAACNSISLPCSNFQPNEFENLYYGIRAIAIDEMRTVKIDRNDFINNYFGVYLMGTNLATIIRNDFEVYRSSAPNHTFGTYGLYLNNSTGYQVEENTFTEFNDPLVASPGNSHGIIVNNSGVLNNEIYRNDFFDISIGGQSQRINSEIYVPADPDPGNTGLRWKCNDFTNDIFRADLAITSGRIAFHQGYCIDPVSDPLGATRAPAGNRFSHSTFDPENDISTNPSVLQFEYSHHTDLETTPLYYDPTIVWPQNCFNSSSQVFYDNTQSCPSKIKENGIASNGIALRSEIDALAQSITNKENLVDGGDKTALLNTVQQGGRTAKTSLISASPYLSDEVILAYLRSSPSANHIEQVILANSPVSSEIISELYQMRLPSSTMNTIINSQSGISSMKLLRNEIEFAQVERSGLINEQIRLFLNDTTLIDPIDSARLIVQRENIQFNKINSGYSSTSFLESLNDPFLLGESERVNYNYEANSYSQTPFLPVVESLEPSNQYSRRIRDTNGENSNIEKDINHSSFKAFPNPTSGQLNISLEGKAFDEEVIIKIYSVTGQLVHSAQTSEMQFDIDMSNYQSGIFLLRVQSTSGTYTQRIIKE